MTSDYPPMKRDMNGRFAKGGSGRPFGARAKVSRRVAYAILADFEANRDEVLPRMREWFLPTYAALIGRLMPRDAGDVVDDEVEPVGTAQMIAAARVALARIAAGEGTLADLESALAGEPPVVTEDERLLIAARAELARIQASPRASADPEGALAGGPTTGEGTDTMGDYR